MGCRGAAAGCAVEEMLSFICWHWLAGSMEKVTVLTREQRVKRLMEATEEDEQVDMLVMGSGGHVPLCGVCSVPEWAG
jgi:hypothetical protein